MKPIGNLILVKSVPTHRVEQMASGLFVERMERPKATEGHVIEKGNQVTLVEVGQKIFFKRYAQHEFKEGEDEFLILSEDDVLLIMDEDE